MTYENNSILTVTDAARKKMLEAIKGHPSAKEISGIRVSIAGVNATDFNIKLGFEKTPADDDIVTEISDLKFFIDPVSAENLKGVSIDFVDEKDQKGFKIDNPNKPDLGGPKPKEGLLDDPRAKAIHQFIQDEINPFVAQHGGVISLLDVNEDSIFIHMGGGCQGCASSQVTLKQGVEKMVKEKFPDIKNIIDSTDHAAGKNPYYKG